MENPKTEKQRQREQIANAYNRLMALNHPIRKQILQILSKRVINVTSLAEKLGITFVDCMRHLRMLKNAKYIIGLSAGRETYYYITPEVAKTNDIIKNFNKNSIKK